MNRQQYQGPERRKSQTEYKGEERRKAQPIFEEQAGNAEQDEGIRQQPPKRDDVH